MAKQLTDKQQRFVEEYLLDLNATQAAIRAGYSEKTAKEMAHENLTKPHIRNAICEKRKAISEKTEITIELLIRTLWNSAQRNLQLKPVTDANGNLVVVDVPEDLIPVYGDTVAAMVKHNPTAAHKAIEMVLRYLGAFTDKVEFSGEVGWPIESAAANMADKEAARISLFYMQEADDRLKANADKTGNNGGSKHD